MKFIDCAAALKEGGSGAKITLEVPGRHKIIMKLVGSDLSVSHDEREVYRVSFKGDTGRIVGLADSRDPTGDCLQKCYDKCGGQALCVDRCSQGCL